MKKWKNQNLKNLKSKKTRNERATLLNKSLGQRKLLSQGFFVNRPVALIVILSGGLSLASFLYFYVQHQTLAYYDAKAHLQIAKQVTNGLTPGFAQLGGVWLPLVHLLMLPTVWIDFFYYSGLAGSIVSMIAYVLASVVLFKTCLFVFQEKKAAFLATLVFMLNPNVLYLSCVPMMESLYLLTFLAALYFFIKFLSTEKPQHLVLSALGTFFATLTRYEGWSLIPVIAVAILLVAWKRKWGLRKLEGMLISYVTLAGFGVALWLLWNAVIFSDPFYFAFGEYSPHASQMILDKEGLLPTKGNPLLALIHYNVASGAVCGIVVYVLFFLGLCLYLVRHLRPRVRSHAPGADVDIHKNTRKNDAHKGLNYTPLGPLYKGGGMGAYLFLLPFFFHTLALSLGQITILIPGLSGVGIKEMYNVRFAVMMVPGVAFFVGYLAKGRGGAHRRSRGFAVCLQPAKRWHRERIAFFLVLAIVLLFYFFMFAHGDIVTLKDGINGWNSGKPRKVEKWLSENYAEGLGTDGTADEGLILTDAYANTCRFIDMKIPIDQFIHQGTFGYWQESLEKPTKHARWIWMTQDDRVWKAIWKKDEFRKNFRQVFKDGRTLVYQRKE